MVCILCKENFSKENFGTTEHPIKSSLIKKTKESSEDDVFVFQQGDSHKEMSNPKNAIQKEKDICFNCKNKVSKEMDEVYDNFCLFILNEQPISFESDFLSKIIDIEQLPKLKNPPDWNKLNKEQKYIITNDFFMEMIVNNEKYTFIPNFNVLQIDKVLLKRYFSKQLACYLNRYDKEVKFPELGEIFLGNINPEGKIWFCFSKTMISYFWDEQWKTMLGNQGVERIKEDNCAWSKHIVGSYVIEIFYGSKESLDKVYKNSSQWFL